VNAEHLTAFQAVPPFFFVSDEMPYAEFFNVLEIANHAHAIPGSVPLIQMGQSVTREAVTTEAVLDFSVQDPLTIIDSTYDAGFRFEAVLTSATGAWFLIPCVCAAEAAIHSAGGNQLRGNCSCLCRSF
jgi:hypothetical protein